MTALRAFVFVLCTTLSASLGASLGASSIASAVEIKLPAPRPKLPPSNPLKSDVPHAQPLPVPDKLLPTPPVPAVAAALLDKPARDVFGALKYPTGGPPRAVGFYADGCMSGAAALPINGDHWQVMRLSRNRNWGHPDLIRYLEALGAKVSSVTRWPGILVGDISQPRGGPAVSGHASHQIGLDADMWLQAMPNRTLTAAEREDMSANNMVTPDWRDINRELWTPAHAAFIKAAADNPQVERVFVNAAIKKELCRTATGDRSWLARVRPWYLHNDHIHVRLRCPAGDKECKGQPPVPAGEGCDVKDFAFWFSDKVLHPKPPVGPIIPRAPKKLAALPLACRAVAVAPDANPLPH